MHHGDGVQEAFIDTNRVCTLSFHQYDSQGNFFPGSGNFDEVGEREGKYCSINVPLKIGLSDNKFSFLFQSVVDRTIAKYQPDAIWMQCGADSLMGDSIGCFNLSIEAHSGAMRHILKKNIPTVFSGGGGYHVENVVRCWTYETMVVCRSEYDGMLLPEESRYRKYFEAPELLYLRKNIHGVHKDFNSDEYCTRLLDKVFQVISKMNTGVGFLEKVRVGEDSFRYLDKRHK